MDAGNDLIVAVSGKMQHGKDTVGDYLIANYGFKRLSFAFKVKEICMEYDNSTPELRDFWNKKVAREVLGNESRADEVDVSMQRVCPGIWTKLTYEECYVTKPDCARIQMQKFATDEMRTLERAFRIENAVVGALQKGVEEGGRWVIADLRFKNEAYTIDTLENSQIWRVRRPIAPTVGAEHVSETDMDDYPFEVFVDNDGTMEDLYKKVDGIIKPLLRGKRPFAVGGEVY